MPRESQLNFDLQGELWRANPHWEGKPGQPLPGFRRWAFGRARRLLEQGLAPATVLRGPRRVGKTVLARQVMHDLIARGVAPRRVIYVPFDDIPSIRKLAQPILNVAHWFEETVLQVSFNEAAAAGEAAYLVFDEVQNLPDWAPQVKFLVDNHSVRLLVTGSSSLRIEAGQDSLAGRTANLDIGPLSLREIAGLTVGNAPQPYWAEVANGEVAEPEFWLGAVAHAAAHSAPRLQSFAAFSRRGAYPEAHEKGDTPWSELAEYLNANVVDRAIRHDLRMGERGRKRDESLLRDLFRLSCRYAGQAPSLRTLVQEVQGSLNANIGPERIRHYLEFLNGSLLLRLVPPLEIRLKRTKSAPKLCLSDHSLRASALHEVVPLDPEGLAAAPHLSELAGHIAESALGYYLTTIPGIQVDHFPARTGEPEVDFVITVGDRRVPVEVKYRRRIDPAKDTEGLRAFLDKSVYRAPLGLLVTLDDGVEVADPRIVPISLSALLWLR